MLSHYLFILNPPTDTVTTLSPKLFILLIIILELLLFLFFISAIALSICNRFILIYSNPPQSGLKCLYQYNLKEQTMQHSKLMAKIYDAKLYSKQMTRKWLSRFNAICYKLKHKE